MKLIRNLLAVLIYCCGFIDLQNAICRYRAAEAENNLSYKAKTEKKAFLLLFVGFMKLILVIVILIVVTFTVSRFI
ncbi:MAG TPA: hypothetical protein PKC14_01465 [Candidatus Absconditabacterales bacterium]|nr:hypothetical protein [Candidatus Absconditabacterales bacterium]